MTRYKGFVFAAILLFKIFVTIMNIMAVRMKNKHPSHVGGLSSSINMFVLFDSKYDIDHIYLIS